MRLIYHSQLCQFTEDSVGISEICYATVDTEKSLNNANCYVNSDHITLAYYQIYNLK